MTRHISILPLLLLLASPLLHASCGGDVDEGCLEALREASKFWENVSETCEEEEGHCVSRRFCDFDIEGLDEPWCDPDHVDPVVEERVDEIIEDLRRLTERLEIACNGGQEAQED